MAWGRVASSGGGTSGSSSPATLNMGTSLSVGDRVIVHCYGFGATPTITNITDNNGKCGTFTKDAETATFNGNGSDSKISTWSAPVTSAGTPQLSITFAASGISASAFAYSGLDTSASSAAVDTSGTAIDDNPSTNTPSATTSGNTTAANELVIGGYGDGDGTVTPTAGNSGISFTRDHANLDASQGTAATESGDSGSSGASKTANWTAAATNGWGATVVVYKLASGGGGGGTSNAKLVKTWKA